MNDRKIRVLRERYKRVKSSTYEWNIYLKNLKKFYQNIEAFVLPDEEVVQEYPDFKKNYERTKRKLVRGYRKEITEDEDVHEFLGDLEEIVNWTNKNEKEARKELKKQEQRHKKLVKEYSSRRNLYRRIFPGKNN